MGSRRFSQVDVFSDRPLLGNPVAVVHDAEGIGEEEMAALARWTNLSETTFLLPPGDGADYRLRILTPTGELPFAGHPTVGSAAAWLAAGHAPREPGVLVQECGVGLVRLRLDPDRPGRLAFAAPPLRRSGPVADSDLAPVVHALGLRAGQVVDAAWADNGPGWMALRLPDADAVLAVDPDLAALGDREVGIVGPHAPGGDTDVEVRAFAPAHGVTEDPVTGSLNAGIAPWLIAAGVVPPRYTAAQGTRLGRRGRVHVAQEGDDVWVGGDTVMTVEGTIAAFTPSRGPRG